MGLIRVTASYDRFPNIDNIFDLVETATPLQTFTSPALLPLPSAGLRNAALGGTKHREVRPHEPSNRRDGRPGVLASWIGCWSSSDALSSGVVQPGAAIDYEHNINGKFHPNPKEKEWVKTEEVSANTWELKRENHSGKCQEQRQRYNPKPRP